MSKRNTVYITDICPAEYLRETLVDFLPWYVEYIRKHIYIYILYGYRMFVSDPAIKDDCICHIGGRLHDVMTEAKDEKFLYLNRHPNIVDLSYMLYNSEEVKNVLIRTLYDYRKQVRRR